MLRNESKFQQTSILSSLVGANRKGAVKVFGIAPPFDKFETALRYNLSLKDAIGLLRMLFEKF